MKKYQDDSRRRSPPSLQPLARDLPGVSSLRFRGRLFLRRVALALFLLYLAVFPGSTITVARDQVPAWGEWMGSALLLLQGAIVLCWLLGSYGLRGALVAALVFMLAWGVEHLGVTTGFPFGRYHYTAQLQPQLFGVVPLAIPCAWLMVAFGAWQIADCRSQIADDLSHVTHHTPQTTLLAATLVLLLDLQIEPVATAINRYWVWLERGAYYGVPAANFAAWWAIGLVMAIVVRWALCRPDQPPATNHQRPADIVVRAQALTLYVIRYTFLAIPACLYLLNTLMFAAINLSRGYTLAGIIGAGVLVVFTVTAIAVAKNKRLTRHIAGLGRNYRQ